MRTEWVGSFKPEITYETARSANTCRLVCLGGILAFHILAGPLPTYLRYLLPRHWPKKVTYAMFRKSVRLMTAI